jgi:hypothetical protein
MFDGCCFLSLFWGYKHNRDQKDERDGGEDNDEEDPKCSRKKKPKLSLKADSKDDGEERDDEMVSSPYVSIQRHAQSSWAAAGHQICSGVSCSS